MGLYTAEQIYRALQALSTREKIIFMNLLSTKQIRLNERKNRNFFKNISNEEFTELIEREVKKNMIPKVEEYRQQQTQKIEEYRQQQTQKIEQEKNKNFFISIDNNTGF
ncbi:hypothetical protein [Histophilus somni]|uniref:hypothetical protein n=1 Tax=Histophilus somni TaxID=731 RepID=UPI00201EFBF4|nr:hypothetical protein [Histophilus somni]